MLTISLATVLSAIPAAALFGASATIPTTAAAKSSSKGIDLHTGAAIPLERAVIKAYQNVAAHHPLFDIGSVQKDSWAAIKCISGSTRVGRSRRGRHVEHECDHIRTSAVENRHRYSQARRDAGTIHRTF